MKDREKQLVADSRKYPVRPHVGVGIILIRNHHLLLIKRKYDPDAGFWSIPGGHVELGEKVQEAAEREGYEETCFKVKVTKLAGVVDKIMYDKNGKIEYHYILINFFVEQIAGNPDQPPKAASDALEAKFVPFEALKNYKLSDSLIQLLKQLKIGFE